MGLIRAAIDSTKTTLADQWKEYFYCDSLSEDVLIEKGKKVVTSGSNTKASEDIISNGTGIAVNEGQAMLIVEDGKIVDFTTEPGRFTWDSSSEPSLFHNGMTGLLDSFKTFGKRFAAGGTPAKNQRIYFVNLKEILNNKFGTATPMPYKDPTYRGIYIRYFGTYTFKIIDPLSFFANISGNVQERYTKTQLMEQCDAEFVNALDEVIAKCGDEGYQYNDLPKRQREIAIFMNDALDAQWHQRRGMEIESVAIIKVTPDDASRLRIEKIDDAIMMADARVASGRLAEAQASALEKAASNEAGAFTGFLGMGMANMAGNQNYNMIQNMGQQPQNPFFTQTTTPTADTWMCTCGKQNQGNFCSECGKPRPSEGFVCSNPECGYTSKEDMKFCPQCGSPKKK